MDKEFCILNDNPPYWRNKRFNGLERNEVFGGRNRKKSIEDGLVVFLTPEQHRTGKHSFHKDPKNIIWEELRKEAEKQWCKYYNKTPDDFLKRYYKNYI